MAIIADHLTDDEILREIGERSRNRRLGRNTPIEQLSNGTGLNRKTIIAFEGGADIRVSSLIKLFRGMNSLQLLEAAFPDVLPGGEGITSRGQPRQKASSRRKGQR